MTAWITLMVASVLTLALRAGPSLVGSSVALPGSLQRANRFAGPALMGALASRSVAGQAAVGGPAVLVAVAVAAPIAYRTHSLAVTAPVGVATYLLSSAMLS
jgi:branched-subunit amino acid transport protein